MFTYDRESFVMRKWQILEFDGKPYYAFVPEDDNPLNNNEISSSDKSQELRDDSAPDSFDYQDELNESLDNHASDESDEFIVEEQMLEREIKPVVLNGTNRTGKILGNLYRVKVEGSMVTLEKLAENVPNTNRVQGISKSIKIEPITSEELDEIDETTESHELNELQKTTELREVNDLQEPNELKETTEPQEPNELRETTEPQEPTEFGDPTEWDSNDTLEEMMETQNMIDEDGVCREEAEKEEKDEVEVEEEEEEELLELRKMGTPRQHPSTISRISGRSLKCKLCSETFSSVIAFRKHVAWTHKKKVCIQENGAYICGVCDFRTLKKSLFADHLDRKHETWTQKRELNSLYPCEACGFVCRSKHSLQSHFIRKHTDTWEHNCQFCDKKFKVKGDLTNHVRFHHKEKPINCDVCGKLCQNTGSLYVHQKWAHYKPKFECNICKRRMVTQENLDQHLITQHEQREKIVCARCGKTFTKKDSFKRHMAVHTGSKPHPCPICTKPFARQSQLRQHVLIHTGKRPFVCDICGKGFTQKPGLICHRKTHPGPLPPLPVMPIADLVRDFIAQKEENAVHELDFE